MSNTTVAHHHTLPTNTTPPLTELPYGLNIEDYWHFMDEWEITDQQKIEWVIELSHLIKGFVDWGIGQDCVQTLLAQNFVDSFSPESTKHAIDSVNMVEQNDNKKFNQKPSE